MSSTDVTTRAGASIPDASAGDRARSVSPLPLGPTELPARPYGARSEQSVIMGDLFMRQVPALARGDLEIVAIARRPGVLSKVAVRRRAGVRLSARPVSLVVWLGGRLRAARQY